MREVVDCTITESADEVTERISSAHNGSKMITDVSLTSTLTSAALEFTRLV